VIWPHRDVIGSPYESLAWC